MMRRILTVLPLLLVALSICAFGQVIDPNVGVYDPGASCAPTCGLHPNPITLTQFGVWNFGNAGEDALPWYIIFAVPNDTTGVPPPLSDGGNTPAFTATFAGDAGAYLPNPPENRTLYQFVGDSGLTTLTATEIAAANNSMANTNMYGAAEVAAFGSMPTSFEVYLYSMSGALPHQTAELFNTLIIAGTFVAVLGASVDDKGHETTFASPFTTAGLGATATSTTTTTTTVGETASAGSGVPEPSGIVLLGSVLLAACAGLRKRFTRS